MRWLVRTTAALAVALAIATAAAASEVSRVEVVGTEFRLVLADGTVRRGKDLVGTVIQFGRTPGLMIRIDSAEIDTLDPDREIWLYGLSTPGAADGTWVDLCPPDHKGFPVSGTWTANGEHIPSARTFSLTCTSGANGKCVRMGYKPWKTGPGGESLWTYHQACVRLLRADYCGDGISHTRQGVAVMIYDRIEIQRDEPVPELDFEAAWGPGGAVCLRKTRVPEISTFDEMRQKCPARFHDWLRERCTEERARDLKGALLFNRS